MTPLEIAQGYVGRGWNVTPVEYRGKRPIGNGWQHRIIDASNVAQYFDGEQLNIGVVLGPSSHKLTDVDEDADEAVAIGPYILPQTQARFGRISKRDSHRLYYTNLSDVDRPAAIAFDDPRRPKQQGRLIELRIGGSSGAQSVLPGSVHKSGEPVAWEEDGEPATVDGAGLLKCVRAVAAYSLLARYWPAEGGGHHDAARVVGGFLARTGLGSETVRVHVEAIARAANSARWRELARTAEDATKAMAAGKHTFGFNGLRETFGADIAEKVAEWLDYKTGDDPANKSKAKAREDELLDALGKAQGLDYARQRKAACEELGVSKQEIDSEVKARREKAPLYGHWIVEPWPETVEGDSLLRDLIRRIRRHVFCSHEDALAIALWVMLSWVHDVATHSPLLVITSAEPMSGKTTMLGVVSFLVPRSIRSVEITEAALYRSLELWHPTFVIDEFDSVLANDDRAALRSVINSGHVRGDGVLRINKDENNEPELFPTFGPKCIGMVGRKLPPQTLTRCVFVELRRRKKDEAVERFKYADDDGLNDLRRRLLRWSMDNEDKLANAEPPIPAELENRYTDNWRLQLAIADLCSGAEEWGDQARAAAIKLERASDNTTTSARLLAAILKATEDVTDDAIGSQQLIDKLTAHPDSEWAEWRHGKAISQAQLARLLKPLRGQSALLVQDDLVTVVGPNGKPRPPPPPQPSESQRWIEAVDRDPSLIAP
jgi:hypothetical protein